MRSRLRVASAFLTAAIICTAAPASAHPQRIVVRSPAGARAVIGRSPFRITFLDSRGHVVLREVASTPVPFLVPPVTQNEFGRVGTPPPTLYAPLSFLVGTHA